MSRRCLVLLCLTLGCVSFATLSLDSPSTIAPTPALSLPMRGQTIRLVATGDTGGDPSKVAAAIAQLHVRTPVDAIILLGDNFYPCGVRSERDAQWSKIRRHFSPIGVPIFPVLGNHDYGNPKGTETRLVRCGKPDPSAQVRATGTLPSWSFPARNYRVQTPLVDIFMIDTTPLARRWSGSFLGSDSSDAILRALEDGLASSNRPWKIVAGHHTIRASGRHGREDPKGEGRMPAVLSLLTRHRVDLYLSGHDHHMELISFEDSDPHQPLFLISGAGSRLRKLNPRSATGLPTVFPPDAKSLLGFALIEISAGVLTVSFYDIKATIRGSFEFTKPVLMFRSCDADHPAWSEAGHVRKLTATEYPARYHRADFGSGADSSRRSRQVVGSLTVAR